MEAGYCLHAPNPFTHTKETWHPLYLVCNALQVLALQGHNRVKYTNIKKKLT